MHITPDMFSNILKKDGNYTVPKNIKNAIETCFDSHSETEITNEYLRISDLFQSYEKQNIPVSISYNGAITLDAYTAYYLSRNIFIPAIALRDLSFHRQFQNIPSTLKILDIGTGTGAVVLGLLSIFQESPFSQIIPEITAIDLCNEAIERQKDLINESGFSADNISYHPISASDVDRLIETVSRDNVYDFIFIANCLTEIGREDVNRLIERLFEILSDNGAIIIAEAQRNYTKSIIKSLATNIRRLGFNVFYPCQSTDCLYPSWCWVWRYHEYIIPDIKVGGYSLREDMKDQLVAIWLIMTKTPASIYDSLKNRRPDLYWGPISKETGEDRAICYNGRTIPFKDESVSHIYKRGHIVGLSEQHKVIEHYSF